MKERRRERGFTLLELLMVVIIIAILASLAIPQYLRATEKARMSEAVSILGQLRDSEIRARSETGTFTSNVNALDFGTGTADLVGTPNYTYTIAAGADATQFVAVATRTGTPPAPCVASYTIRVNQAGAFAGRDCLTTLQTVP